MASNTAPEMLDRAIRDERKAYALGVRDPALATSLGFDIYRQWLNKPSGSVPSDALHFDRLAVSADPADPIPRMNVGLALLADGDETKAIEAYQTAVQQILSLGGDHGQQTAWFASGMTDLDNLAGSAFASSRPSLVGQVIQMKERVAGSLADGKNVEPSDTGATLSIDPSRAGLYVTPTALDVNVPETGWDPVTNDLRREPISLVWYTRSAPGQGSSSGAWNAIAEATDFGASTKSPFGFDASNDVYVHNSNLLSSIPAQCVPNGQYRVEIYIGGHLAYASPVQTLTGIPNLIGRTEPDMEIGVCVPNNWVLKAAPTVQWTGGRNQGARATLAGIMFGYSAKDGSEGAYLFRLSPLNGALHDPTQTTQTVVNNLLDYAVRHLGGVLPSDIAPDGSPTAGAGAFMNGSPSSFAWYKSPSAGVTVRVGAGKTSDNAVVVGLVYGPSADFVSSSSLGVSVFGSFAGL